MSSVKSIIEQLKATDSKNAKLSILHNNKDNEALKETFVAALNPYIHYWTKKLPPVDIENPPYGISSELNISSALVSIGYLESREGIKSTLQTVSNCISEGDREFWDSVVAKDLTCGVSATTVNKVWPKLIPQFKPMKGEEAAHLNSMKLPLVVQPKMDGARVLITHVDGVVKMFSSGGNEYPYMDSIKTAVREEARRLPAEHKNFIIDGELIFRSEDGSYDLPRETSNGLANKSQHGNLTSEQERRAIFHVFDFVNELALEDGDSRPYLDRYSILEFLLHPELEQFEVIPYAECDSFEEVNLLFDQAVIRGEEGIMVKEKNHAYEPKRSKSWVKLKKEFDVDVVITGWIPHSKKEDQVGSIKVKTDDGLIVGNVGSKLTDKLRKELYQAAIAGTLVDRLCTITIHDLSVKDGQLTFYLPRFIEFRDDKYETDTCQKVKDMVLWDKRKEL